jgi:signal transduction histidine kinase
MKPRSLRVRLMTNAAILISLALALAGLGTYLQFKKYSQDIVLQQLDAHFVELLAGLELDPQGRPFIAAPLSDPRFSKPYSGLYWQVDIANQESARSRSLWDERLNLSAPSGSSEQRTHELDGPNQSKLIGVERAIDLEGENDLKARAVVTIAVDAATMTRVQDRFLRDVLLGLGALYIVLLGGSLAQVLLGLRPLQTLRHKIETISSGKAQRVSEEYPKEVMPLIGALNGLLESRENQLERARHRAGNLAHGLKTPLTVMQSIAEDLEDKGETQIASELTANAHVMRDLVERELVRARTSADAHAVQTELVEVVDKIFLAVQHVKQKGVMLENQISRDTMIAMEKGDAFELVGNLVDNARRYAKSLIRVSGTPTSLTVEDDGKGVPPEKLSHIVKRGIKLDSKGGTGLGLAIVTDLADAYGFGLQLAHSPLGGLQVTLDWSHPKPVPQT